MLNERVISDCQLTGCVGESPLGGHTDKYDIRLMRIGDHHIEVIVIESILKLKACPDLEE